MPCMENPAPPGSKFLVTNGSITATSITTGVNNFTVNSGAFTLANVHAGNITVGGLTGAVGTSGPCGTAKPRPPANWRQINVRTNQYEEEIFENPLGGRAVHVSSLSLSNGASRHHWKIFCALYPQINYLLIGVSHIEAANQTTISNVAFPDPDDGRIFEAWLDEYAKPFGDRDNLYHHRYPPLPKRTPPLTSLPLITDGVNDIDLSLWLAKSCVAPYYVAGRIILFESDEDAVAYTLKFE